MLPPDPEVPTDCFGILTASDDGLPCEEYTLFPYCELEFAGSFELKAESKEGFPQFCKEVGDTITYTNAGGEKLHLVVSEREFSNFGITYDSKQECVSDNTLTIGYCYDIEFAILYLKSVSAGLDFLIALDIVPTIQ
ncbi:MAG: hypothetical protein ACI9LN_002055 [Saprospiraceae bacterium]|jgi:hypothetical protein